MEVVAASSIIHASMLACAPPLKVPSANQGVSSSFGRGNLLRGRVFGDHALGVKAHHGHSVMSARAGLVDGLVDELVRISKAGGTIRFPAAFGQINGGMSLLPPPSDLVATPVSSVKVEKDTLRQQQRIDNLRLFRQTFVIRSYEVGADKAASIETLMNFFQETALNHVRLSGIEGDGFGTTKAMVRNELIWVVNRIHVEVESYPKWCDMVEIESWVASSGKNGLRRDWLLRDVKTGRILARSTSTWVMMHQRTRRLSKMPDEVRDEISCYFLNRFAIPDQQGSLKISRLESESAHFVASNLQARRSDLDMNHHVNNVKYLAWMVEGVPAPLVENQQIKSITIEYRRECGHADVVESLTSTVADQPSEFPPNGSRHIDGEMHHQHQPMETRPRVRQFTHSLKLQGSGAEIVRGRTVWTERSGSSLHTS